MATQTGGFIRDQNRNLHFDVTSPSGLKANKPLKNGGLSGRKALGDISNSRRASTLKLTNKLSSKNAISVAEDFGPPITKSSFGGKTKVSTKNAGRKALGDLTNSVKPRATQEAKKTQDKKLSAIVEMPFPLDEHSLHDHGKCIKAQEKAMALELEYFTKEYGLGNSMQSSPPRIPPSPAKMKPEKSSIRFSEMEEVLELLQEDASQCNKYEVSSEETHCASPISPSSLKWADDMILTLKSP